MAPFTRVLGFSADEAARICREGVEALRNKNFHVYSYLYVPLALPLDHPADSLQPRSIRTEAGIIVAPATIEIVFLDSRGTGRVRLRVCLGIGSARPQCSAKSHCFAPSPPRSPFAFQPPRYQSAVDQMQCRLGQFIYPKSAAGGRVVERSGLAVSIAAGIVFFLYSAYTCKITTRVPRNLTTRAGWNNVFRGHARTVVFRLAPQQHISLGTESSYLTLFHHDSSSSTAPCRETAPNYTLYFIAQY